MGWCLRSSSSSKFLLIFYWLLFFSFYGKSERKHLCPRVVCLHSISKRYFHVYIFIILSLTNQKHLHKLELSLSPCLADKTESQSTFLSSPPFPLLSFLMMATIPAFCAQEVLTPWLWPVLSDILFINVCGWLTLGKLSQEPRFCFHCRDSSQRAPFLGVSDWYTLSCPQAVYSKSPRISTNTKHGTHFFHFSSPAGSSSPCKAAWL